MSRKGENIYRRKDGRWEGRYIRGRDEKGTVYGYVYAASYKEAKEKKLLAMQKEGFELQKILSGKSDKEKICFKQYAGSWLFSIKAKAKKSTVVKYENILLNYLFPELENRIVETITSEEISHFCTRLLLSGGQEGKGLSSKTVSDILVVLKKVLAFAAQNGGCPYPDVNMKGLKQNQKAMRVLSLEEQKILTGYLQMHPSLTNIGILTCLYTGIRIGELCALKWGDIHFKEQYIHVCKTLQRLQTALPLTGGLDGEKAGAASGQKKTQIIISEPKSSCSIRKIPIPKELYQILWDRRKEENAYVLTGLPGTFIEPRTMENRFKTVLQKCDIENTNFHVLRHTFATRCVELGFDIKSLSEILGHASVNITLNRYMHPSMELKQKNMELVSNLFSVKSPPGQP